MLKTKYQRMTKAEKKELITEYKKSSTGHDMMKRLLRLQIIGGVGILYAVFLFLSSIKDLKIYDLGIIPLFLISIFFIFMSFRLKNKTLNNFAIKKK